MILKAESPTVKVWSLIIVLSIQTYALHAFHHSFAASDDTGLEMGGAVDVLSATLSRALRESTHPSLCSLMLIVDGSVPHTALRKMIANTHHPQGYSVVELELPDVSEGNVTKEATMEIPDVISEARKMRLASWCLMVVVVTEDLQFLEWLGEALQNGRLLVWNTYMVVLSKIQHSELLRLMRGSWTYSMMSTVFVNQAPELSPGKDNEKWTLYAQQPYSSRGSQAVRLASWSPKRGFYSNSQLPFFREKFENFHGTEINITALTFEPYWEDIKSGERGAGTDYFMLEAIARSLNMTFRVVPTENWDQVVTRVQERVAFLSSIGHLILPLRQDAYDFSFSYEYSSVSFSMAKPALKPQWQSLYYPLTDQVWASILAIVLFFPLPLYVFSKIGRGAYGTAGDTVSDTLLVIGTLLGQNLRQNLPERTSYRMLLGFWLIFAFIVSVAYRGNLTASLTSPKYPPRAENIFELVQVGARVGIPPYGQDVKDYFLASDSPVYRTVGERITIVPTFMEGLQRVIEENFAYLDSRRYTELQIAKHFTRPDGSTDHYLAREDAYLGLVGWPFPHDAPYKHIFDDKIMNIIEAGLYEKWRGDMLDKARREGQRKANENRAEKEASEEGQMTDLGAGIALTLTHMQGPLYLLLIGYVLGSLALCSELLLGLYYYKGKE